jgi:simple sugar transport system ATP-binding protein
MSDVTNSASPLAAPPDAFIELSGIIKDYGAIRALDDVSFWVTPAEIVGLVGDNGAGKSTLIKIISGVLQPTSGTIRIEGTPIRFESSKIAMDHGIETIYQDMNLIDVMDITRNIFCGREEANGMGFLKMSSMKEKAMSVLQKEITIEGIRSPGQRVGHLSGGQKQAVSIARAMLFKKRLLLLDEPTSALSVRETQAFLDHIVHLRSEGMSVVLVTHNIYHAHQVADRFVLLSHGRKIMDTLKKDTSTEELTRIIVAH